MNDQATKTLKRCFPAVLTSLEREVRERSNTTACGLSVFLRKYNFIASLIMMCDVLPHMSALSKAMQTRDAVYTTIGPLVTGTLSIIRQLQEQPGQHFSTVDETIQSLRHQGFDIAEPTQDEMEKFKRNVYDKFHSQLVENLEARFPDLPLTGNFGAFDLRDVNDDIDTHGNEQLKELAQHFTLPDTDVATEWRQVKAAIRDEGLSAEKNMEWITKYLNESHPNLYKLAAVGLLLPTSTADCERGFSCLNRIKTAGRSNLSNKVLNSLLSAVLQGPPLEEVNFESMVEEWYKNKPRRGIM